MTSLRSHMVCDRTRAENKAHFVIIPGASQVALAVKNKKTTCRCMRQEMRVNPGIRKIPWRRAWQPTPLFLPGNFHEQRSLVGYSPWVHKESDMTK